MFAGFPNMAYAMSLAFLDKRIIAGMFILSSEHGRDELDHHQVH
jgi:hypothetical protein